MIMTHQTDQYTLMEESVRRFTHTINPGQILYWGTSESSAFVIDVRFLSTVLTILARSLHRSQAPLIAPIADEPQTNLFTRQCFEEEYGPLYKLYHYGTTIWRPLGADLLSGEHKEGIPKLSCLAIEHDPLMKRFRNELETEDGKARIAKVKELAALRNLVGAELLWHCLSI